MPPSIDATWLAIEYFSVPHKFSFLCGTSKLYFLFLDGVKLKGIELVSLGTKQGFNSQDSINILLAMCGYVSNVPQI